MDKERYWKEKNARLRYQKMRRLLKTNTGTHRINWLQPGDDRTHYGGWVYDNAAEAQADAERFVAEKSAVVSAWVEKRETRI